MPVMEGVQGFKLKDAEVHKFYLPRADLEPQVAPPFKWRSLSRAHFRFPC